MPNESYDFLHVLVDTLFDSLRFFIEFMKSFEESTKSFEVLIWCNLRVVLVLIL